ncbi:MAG: hypothetical protein KDJ45_08410 [Hyphomicrobiaceae bacterium]|nr:hypothetical protein [Hyphomicrobiaceae bacterium]MCC0010020.1 hypothetical protein [Hyphomicrobiaceae bacterium]
MIDNLFLLAIGAFGWGLSLTTYRLFARKYDWPMGSLHADLPAIPILVGLFALVMGLLFAAARGVDYGGWIIVVGGLLLAIFWTGFLRVGSQISLVLAPLAATLLLMGWLPSILGYERPKWAYSRPGDLIKREPDSVPARPDL